MSIKQRIVLATAATALVLTTLPSAASPPRMTCSEPFEAVCIAIGTACRALDTVEAKVLDKDLINCQLG